MRHSWPTFVLISLLALAQPSVAVADPPPDEPASCRVDSWIGGSTDLCDGRLVYRDYVYDDYGADDGSSPSKSFGSLSPQAGDQRYAADDNSADLVALRMWIDGDRLRVSFELSSLFHADSTVAALAVDTDDNRQTGGGAWRDLGVASDGWDVLETFGSGDPTTNRIEGSMPVPAGTRWRVQAVTGVRDGPVMNVAFRGTDETGAWWEAKQAAELGDGDVSTFGHTVDVADLRAGTTRLHALRPGFYERVYRSRHAVPPGEGISYDGVDGRASTAPFFPQKYHFLGHYQPYGVYVPRTPAPHGIQLVMHGFSANHASLIGNAGVQNDLGDARNRIVAVPLGRGMAGFYSDYSERDVLDVLGDLERSYSIDRDRVFAGGYSMGGYGTYRMAALHPDRFAGFISWVGFTGDAYNGVEGGPSYSGGAIGNMVDFVRNLRHVQGAMLYAGGDELVHVSTAREMESRFRELGYPYIWYMHPAAEHFTFAVADDWEKESLYTAGLRRVTRPPRVTFRTADFLGNPALGIRHDRAYWVSEIRPRSDGYADTDLTTQGCGGRFGLTRHEQDAGPRPVPWTSESAVPAGTTPVTRADRFHGTLANVRSLSIDVEEACLAGDDIGYDFTTDGPVAISFSDGRTLHIARAGRHRGALVRPQARIRLSIRPARAVTWRRTHFSFVADAPLASGGYRRVSGATIRFANTRLRTNRRGRAGIVRTFREPRLLRVRASRTGLLPGYARVRILRRRGG